MGSYVRDAEEREENANRKTRSKRKSVSEGGSFQDLRKGNSEELSEKKWGGGREGPPPQGVLFVLSLEVENCRVGQ